MLVSSLQYPSTYDNGFSHPTDPYLLSIFKVDYLHKVVFSVSTNLTLIRRLLMQPTLDSVDLMYQQTYQRYLNRPLLIKQHHLVTMSMTFECTSKTEDGKTANVTLGTIHLQLTGKVTARHCNGPTVTRLKSGSVSSETPELFHTSRGLACRFMHLFWYTLRNRWNKTRSDVLTTRRQRVPIYHQSARLETANQSLMPLSTFPGCG